MKTDIQLPKYEVLPVALNAGQVVDWGAIYLRAPEFWNENNRGEDAIIFVADTAGVFDHVDLIPNAIPSLDFNATSDPAKDKHGHGTHCAGIAAAADNDKGIVGIAPGAGLVALKCLNDSGGGSFTWIANCIRYVADLQLEGDEAGKRKIISMSLGTGPGFATPKVMDEAIRYAVSKGVFFVAAAGNSGFTPGGKSTVGAPGNHPLVLTVASSAKPGDKRSSFSSGGSEVELIAPGSGIYSTHKDNGYAYLSGTSMACPQVSGIVALLLTQFPEIETQQQLIQFITANATDILAKGKDDESGYGSPIVVNYVDQDPGDEPDQPDEDPDDNPDEGPGDQPEEPESPKYPERWNEATVRIPLSGMVYASLWKTNDERGYRTAIVRDLVVEVKSNIDTETIGQIVRDYVQMFFTNRAMILKNGFDHYEAGYFVGLFLQYVADDDNVFEKFGIRLDLKVLSLRYGAANGVDVLIEQNDIAERGRYTEAVGDMGIRMVQL